MLNFKLPVISVDCKCLLGVKNVSRMVTSLTDNMVICESNPRGGSPQLSAGVTCQRRQISLSH